MACRTTLVRPLALITFAPILFAATPAHAGATRNATLHFAHVGATGSGFQHGDCPDVAGWGWHFVVPGNGDFVTLSVTFERAGRVSLGAGQFGPPDASHAYVFTPGDDTLLSGTATITGGNAKKDTFNLSHTCPGKTTPPTPTPSPTTNPPTTRPPTNPPTTNPPTNPPTTNPPTTNPPTHPPTTNPPTTTPPTTTNPPTPSETSSPTVTPSPDVSPSESGSPQPSPSQTTSTTGTPAVSPSVKGTRLVRGSAGTLPQTGGSAVPLALLGCALVAIGGVAIIRSTRRRQASRR